MTLAKLIGALGLIWLGAFVIVQAGQYRFTPQPARPGSFALTLPKHSTSLTDAQLADCRTKVMTILHGKQEFHLSAEQYWYLRQVVEGCGGTLTEFDAEGHSKG